MPIGNVPPTNPARNASFGDIPPNIKKDADDIANELDQLAQDLADKNMTAFNQDVAKIEQDLNAINAVKGQLPKNVRDDLDQFEQTFNNIAQNPDQATFGALQNLGQQFGRFYGALFG